MKFFTFSLFAFALLLIFHSCSKSCIRLADIRQTDATGKVLNAGNPREWKAVSDSGFFYTYFYPDYRPGYYEGKDTSGAAVYLPIRFSQNQHDTFSVSFYPNPVSLNSAQGCTLKVASNKNIIAVLFNGVAGFDGTRLPLTPAVKTVYLPLDAKNDYAGYSGGPVYYAIITDDSCTYVGYGLTLVQGRF